MTQNTSNKTPRSQEAKAQGKTQTQAPTPGTLLATALGIAYGAWTVIVWGSGFSEEHLPTSPQAKAQSCQVEWGNNPQHKSQIQSQESRPQTPTQIETLTINTERNIHNDSKQNTVHAGQKQAEENPLPTQDRAPRPLPRQDTPLQASEGLAALPGGKAPENV